MCVMQTPRGVEKFQLTGQAWGGSVPDHNVVLVLDTNVISALYSVARNGFDLEKTTDRRVAHLLDWLAARPDVSCSTLFGVVEGAGFHRGGLSSFHIVQRATAAVLTINYGRRHHRDWVVSGEPLPPMSLPVEHVHPRAVMEAAEALLPWTVLPSYVAALLVALIDKQGTTGVAALEELYARLVEELNFIPTFGLVVGSLAFVGTRSLKRELRQTLFKLQATDIKRSCLSAGWDLGYLQLLSLSRFPGITLFDGRVPVLATADRQLVPTALLPYCSDNTGTFALGGELFDTQYRDDAMATLMRMQVERLGVTPQAPEWGRCAAATARLEQELGIEGSEELALVGPPVTVSTSLREYQAFLRIVNMSDPGAAVEALAHSDEDLLWAGLSALGALVADNARAREQAVDVSWRTLASSLDTGSKDIGAAAITLNLARAMGMDDGYLMAAWAEQLEMENLQGVALVWLWLGTRSILEDTADCLGRPIEELLRRIEQQLAQTETVS
jgi:hypothetical protein